MNVKVGSTSNFDITRHETDPCPTCKGTGRVAKAKMSDPCPFPDILGWTIQQCFDAKRCSCTRGALLGYKPVPWRADGEKDSR